ncbi:MAG: hypothetical protein RLZZ450_44 [Pseudomonadota bacterium]
MQFATTLPNAPALLGDSVTLLEALTFVESVAEGSCFVINASLGRHAGEHDGSTLTEQAMDHFLLAAPGRAIVQSCGNYFDRGIHTSGVLRPGQTERRRMLVEEGDRTPNELDLWYPGADRFRVTVRGPGRVGEVSVRGDEQALVVVDGQVLGRLYHRLGDPNNGDNQVTLFLYRGAPAGAWEVELFGEDVVDGRFHAWVERDAACAGCQARFAPEDRDPTGTLGTICNGLRTLAVGAYDAHDPRRPLARFSSAGRTRDGREKPDLVAPGVAILAARSRPRTTSEEAALLTRMSGTSMSAPHVTGTIALMFEAAGRPLRIEETRSLLLGHCDPSESTLDLDQYRHGSGYLNTDAAVAATLHAARTNRFTARTAQGTAPQLSPRVTDWRQLPMDPNNSANSSSGVAPEHDAEARSDERGTKQGRTSRFQPSPFQFQIPPAGGPPALGIPIGGPGSPLGFSIPLGGASLQPAAPAPVASAAPNVTGSVTVGAATALGATPPRMGSELEPVAVATSEPLYAPPAPEWMEAEEYEISQERSGLGSSEPAFGQRVLAAAESLIAAGSHGRTVSSSALLRALFHGPNALAAPAVQAPTAPLAPHGAAPSATALFKVLAYPRASAARRGAIERLYGTRYAVLARPGDPLSNIAPAPGDLLLRVARGEAWGHVAVVASPALFAHEQLVALRLQPEGAPRALPGHYLHVVELAPIRRLASERFVRRLCDAAGVVLPDTLWLRPIDPRALGSNEPTRRVDTRSFSTHRASSEVGSCAVCTERLGEDAGAPAVPVPAGRLVVNQVPLLRAHRGTRPDLILSWNRMPSAPRAVDVVVHLHGFSRAGAQMSLERDKEPMCGLDFSDPDDPSAEGRREPTLCVLPRGNFYGGRSGAGYDFPALLGSDGLSELIRLSLAQLAAQLGQREVSMRRLILTAHSGGGAALMGLLAGTDPDEVHIYDALYGDASRLIAWAGARLLRPDAADSALRVVYIAGTGTAAQSERVARALRGAIPVGDPRATRFRVEASALPHNAIPRRSGFRLLRDAGADLTARVHTRVDQAPTREHSDAPVPERADEGEPGESDDSSDNQHAGAWAEDQGFADDDGPPPIIPTKTPLAVPPGTPVPFAPAPGPGSFWPIITSHRTGRSVSFLADDGTTVGQAGRRFFADRTSGNRHHAGVDLFANLDDRVVAIEDGQIVSFFGFCCGEHHTTFALLIAHAQLVVNYGELAPDSLSRAGLRIGSRVRAGDLVGFVGRNPEGSSMLHLETYVPGTQANARWPRGAAAPASLFNPTSYLLHLQQHGRVGGSALPGLPTPLPGLTPPPAGPLAAPNRRSPAYIAWVQTSLNAIAHAGLVVDGISGPRTRAAVRAFQQSRGLTQDGIVGPHTEAALLASGATAPFGALPTPVPQVTPPTPPSPQPPPPPPISPPPQPPLSAETPISDALVLAVTPLQFANAANIDEFFRRTSGADFVDWFNARIAGTGLWSRSRLEPARTPTTAKARFRQIWDRIPELFGTPTVNLFQFLSLMSIIINETGGQMLPISERVGRPGHPGIAYAFDRIPGTKHSYNAGGNRTALQLFNDSEFLNAHGGLPLAARVRDTTDARWGGDVYPQGDFPTSTDPSISGILLQADFYKFRGRGLIQTTFRDAYRRVIAHIQNHAPTQAVVADFSRRWAGRSAESIATTTSNEDWNRLYEETDLWVAAASVHLHSQSKRNYLTLPLDARTLNGRQNGSIWNVGRQVSGSERYADLLRGRVLQMIRALPLAAERPSEQAVG